jgi:transposase InsO family protein
MSRKGNCWDNACSETLFGSLKVEWLDGQRFATIREAMTGNVRSPETDRWSGKLWTRNAIATAGGGRCDSENLEIEAKAAPKSVLRLPALEQSKSAVLNSLTSPSSQRSRDHVIRTSQNSTVSISLSGC